MLSIQQWDHKLHNYQARYEAYIAKTISYFWLTGSIKIDELRLSIFGAIQPTPLVELLNSVEADHQGFWDRFLLIPAAKVHCNKLRMIFWTLFAQDHNVEIKAQLTGIPEDVKIDIDEYIKCIHQNHKEARIYKASEEAMAKFLKYKIKLNEIDAKSDYG